MKIFLNVVLGGVLLAMLVVGWWLSELTPVSSSRVVSVVEFVTPVAGKSICLSETEAYRQVIRPILTEWEDANQLANNTPHLSLSPQIDKLREIKHTVDVVAPTMCTLVAHMALLNGMQSGIDGYLAALADKPESEVAEHFTNAAELIKRFEDELERAAGM
jgi:hypothetical protein